MIKNRQGEQLIRKRTMIKTIKGENKRKRTIIKKKDGEQHQSKRTKIKNIENNIKQRTTKNKQSEPYERKNNNNTRT